MSALPTPAESAPRPRLGLIGADGSHRPPDGDGPADRWSEPRNFTRIVNEALRELHGTPLNCFGRLANLAQLARSPSVEVSDGDLAQSCGVSPTAIGRALKRLEDDGWITRRRGRGRRLILIHPRTKGPGDRAPAAEDVPGGAVNAFTARGECNLTARSMHSPRAGTQSLEGTDAPREGVCPAGSGKAGRPDAGKKRGPEPTPTPGPLPEPTPDHVLSGAEHRRMIDWASAGTPEERRVANRRLRLHERAQRAFASEPAPDTLPADAPPEAVAAFYGALGWLDKPRRDPLRRIAEAAIVEAEARAGGAQNPAPGGSWQKTPGPVERSCPVPLT